MSDPKYIMLQKYIKEQIRKGTYGVGERLPSENELAQELNISRHTVLKGMALLLAEGWIERFQGRGTFVAMRSEGALSTSRTVALICSDLNDSLIMHIVAGMSGFLRKYKYELLILDTNRNTALEAEYLDSLEDRGLAGAFFWPHMPPANRGQVEYLHARSFPLVLLDRGYDGLEVPVVGTENEVGAYEITRHLIEMGHYRIAHITSAVDEKHSVGPVRMREAGFCRALKEADIPLPDEFLQYADINRVEQVTATASLDGILEYYEAMHRLLALQQPPTAVFLLNDFLAPSCIKAIENQGLIIPKDIALAGFDNNLDANEFSIALTSYVQPGREIGRRAGEIFVKLYNGDKLKKYIYRIPGQIIVRQSSLPVQLAQAS